MRIAPTPGFKVGNWVPAMATNLIDDAEWVLI